MPGGREITDGGRIYCIPARTRSQWNGFQKTRLIATVFGIQSADGCSKLRSWSAMTSIGFPHHTRARDGLSASSINLPPHSIFVNQIWKAAIYILYWAPFFKEPTQLLQVVSNVPLSHISCLVRLCRLLSVAAAYNQSWYLLGSRVHSYGWKNAVDPRRFVSV